MDRHLDLMELKNNKVEELSKLQIKKCGILRKKIEIYRDPFSDSNADLINKYNREIMNIDCLMAVTKVEIDTASTKLTALIQKGKKEKLIANSKIDSNTINKAHLIYSVDKETKMVRIIKDVFGGKSDNIITRSELVKLKELYIEQYGESFNSLSMPNIDDK